MIKCYEFRNGLTVAELKDLLSDWPEVDEDGNPCEVWVANGCYSNVVTHVAPLNIRQGESREWADIILDVSASKAAK